MTYRELKKQIKAASKEQKIDGITAYIAYQGARVETLISNFIENCKGITDDQLIKAENEGLLVRDWDTLEVV
jgi:hypothetical protein